MYDGHLKSDYYYKYKSMIAQLYNGEKVNWTIPWLKEKIQQSYDEGRLQGGQYDQLMGMLQEIEYY